MQVSVRELKSHLSHYLQQAHAGQRINITSHRKIIACLQGSTDQNSSGLDKLLAGGTVTWSGKKPRGSQVTLPKGDKSMSELVLEMRG